MRIKSTGFVILAAAYILISGLFVCVWRTFVHCAHSIIRWSADRSLATIYNGSCIKNQQQKQQHTVLCLNSFFSSANTHHSQFYQNQFNFVSSHTTSVFCLSQSQRVNVSTVGKILSDQFPSNPC